MPLYPLHRPLDRRQGGVPSPTPARGTYRVTQSTVNNLGKIPFRSGQRRSVTNDDYVLSGLQDLPGLQIEQKRERVPERWRELHSAPIKIPWFIFTLTNRIGPGQHETPSSFRRRRSRERGHLARLNNRGPSARCGQDARAPGNGIPGMASATRRFVKQDDQSLAFRQKDQRIQL